MKHGFIFDFFQEGFGPLRSLFMSNEKSSAFVISSGQQDSVVQNLKFKNLIKMTAKILSASHGNWMFRT